MKTYKRIFAMFLAMIMALSLVACGGGAASGDNSNDSGDKVYKWKLATNIVETTKTGAAFAEFSKKIEEATNGRVVVDNFYGGSLGAEADVMANCQTGSVQIVQLSFSLLAQFNEAFNVMDLPFIFDSKEHMERFMATEEAQAMIESFHDSANLWVPGVWLMGYRFPNMVNGPIEKVDDFKGVIFRTMDSAVQMATLEALGATPITVPYNDVYNALSSGVAEGWSCDCSGYITTSSCEVAKYISTIPLFAVANGILVSDKALEELPEDLRTIVKDTINSEFPAVMQQMYDENLDQLQQCADAGAIVNDVDDVQPFIDAVKPVWDDVASKYSGVQEMIDVIDSVR